MKQYINTERKTNQETQTHRKTRRKAKRNIRMYLYTDEQDNKSDRDQFVPTDILH